MHELQLQLATFNRGPLHGWSSIKSHHGCRRPTRHSPAERSGARSPEAPQRLPSTSGPHSTRDAHMDTIGTRVVARAGAGFVELARRHVMVEV